MREADWRPFAVIKDFQIIPQVKVQLAEKIADREE